MGSRFLFDDWQFDTTTRELSRQGEGQRLTPKSASTLRVLLASPREVVSRERFMTCVWPGSGSGEEVLTHAVAEIRRVLGDAPKQPRYIETVPKSGYRFLTDVECDRRQAAPDRAPGSSEDTNKAAFAYAQGAIVLRLQAEERLSNGTAS